MTTTKRCPLKGGTEIDVLQSISEATTSNKFANVVIVAVIPGLEFSPIPLLTYAVTVLGFK